MKYIPLLLCTLIALPAFADDCRVTRTVELEFDPAAYEAVNVQALAGYLEVSSTPADNITFWGKFCTDTEVHLDMMDVDVREIDGRFKLEAVIPYHQRDFDPRYATIDIEVRLPQDMPVTLEDSSGDMNVEGVAVTSIGDSSGDIRVSDNQTSVVIKDSSGEIDLRLIEGSVRISDSSGNIEVSNVTGDVVVPGDSSGNIDIRRVSGSVHVEQDSSGDITIAGVGKDVMIGSDGSGDIEVEDVEGMVGIDADGSGRVRVRHVAGAFSLGAKGSGAVETRDIDGELKLPSRHM